jgi:hypothetical protein
MPVKILTICFGILLTLLGAVYYYVSGMAGILTLMPTIFGLLITLFGILQGKWDHRHALYGSLLLATLTFIGSLRALFSLFGLLRGDELAEPVAVIVRSVIGVTCLLFIALGLTFISDFWTGWKAFGQFMGDWLARVVLTIFYFTVLVPFGIGVRLFGDPLHIKTHPSEFWQKRTTGDQELQEVRRQF